MKILLLLLILCVILGYFAAIVIYCIKGEKDDYSHKEKENFISKAMKK